jgi:hypothetical protein
MHKHLGQHICMRRCYRPVPDHNYTIPFADVQRTRNTFTYPIRDDQRLHLVALYWRFYDMSAGPELPEGHDGAVLQMESGCEGRLQWLVERYLCLCPRTIVVREVSPIIRSSASRAYILDHVLKKSPILSSFAVVCTLSHLVELSRNCPRSSFGICYTADLPRRYVIICSPALKYLL